jgi:hypothetical protein
MRVLNPSERTAISNGIINGIQVIAVGTISRRLLDCSLFSRFVSQEPVESGELLVGKGIKYNPERHLLIQSRACNSSL